MLLLLLLLLLLFLLLLVLVLLSAGRPTTGRRGLRTGSTNSITRTCAVTVATMCSIITSVRTTIGGRTVASATHTSAATTTTASPAFRITATAIPAPQIPRSRRVSNAPNIDNIDNIIARNVAVRTTDTKTTTAAKTPTTNITTRTIPYIPTTTTPVSAPAPAQGPQLLQQRAPRPARVGVRGKLRVPPNRPARGGNGSRQLAGHGSSGGPHGTGEGGRVRAVYAMRVLVLRHRASVAIACVGVTVEVGVGVGVAVDVGVGVGAAVVVGVGVVTGADVVAGVLCRPWTASPPRRRGRTRRRVL